MMIAVNAAVATDALPGTDSLAGRYYLVVYRHGPRWVEDVCMVGQNGMRAHFNYYLDMYRKGNLRLGGASEDESGGAAVFAADDDQAATMVIESDPAVQSGVFAYELKQWRLIPWSALAGRPSGTS